MTLTAVCLSVTLSDGGAVRQSARDVGLSESFSPNAGGENRRLSELQQPGNPRAVQGEGPSAGSDRFYFLHLFFYFILFVLVVHACKFYCFIYLSSSDLFWPCDVLLLCIFSPIVKTDIFIIYSISGPLLLLLFYFLLSFFIF